MYKRMDAAYAIYGKNWYALDEEQQDYVENWLSMDEYLEFA